MAYNIRKIEPVDLERRYIVGVRMPFSSPSVFTPVYQSKDAIKTNILNYFLTAKGDRFLNPSFGNELLNQLFEQYSDSKKGSIIQQIKYDLQRYFPKITVEELTLENYENSVQMYLKYSINDTGTYDELIFDFNR